MKRKLDRQNPICNYADEVQYLISCQHSDDPKKILLKVYTRRGKINQHLFCMMITALNIFKGFAPIIRDIQLSCLFDRQFNLSNMSTPTWNRGLIKKHHSIFLGPCMKVQIRMLQTMQFFVTQMNQHKSSTTTKEIQHGFNPHTTVSNTSTTLYTTSSLYILLPHFYPQPHLHLHPHQHAHQKSKSYKDKNQIRLQL